MATGWQPKWLDLANLGPKAIESERQARIRAFERLTPSEVEAALGPDEHAEQEQAPQRLVQERRMERRVIDISRRPVCWVDP